MFDVKRLVVCLAVVLAIGLVSAHEALAQNGAITNPGSQPVIINPVVEPTVVTGQVGVAVIPIVVQPQFVITPSVNPNGAGPTDPLGNPYRNLTTNPLTIPIVPTPGVSPFSIPVIFSVPVTQNPS
jgi:hypothetical protein